MEIGFVGLGKMGGNMVLRLVQGSPDGKIKGGHTVVGYATDPNPDLAGVGGVTIVKHARGAGQAAQAAAHRLGDGPGRATPPKASSANWPRRSSPAT